MPGPDTPPILDDFPHRARDTIRYGDTDRQGHVNNAVFATFFETGRVFFFNAQQGMVPAGCEFVIARLVVDFRAEMRWPGVVDIGTRVMKVGRSSASLAQALFQDGRCVASGESVIVLTDESTRRSTPLPPAMREYFEAAVR